MTFNDHVKGTPILEPRQCVRKRLFFCRDHRPLKPLVQFARGFHRSGFCFDQIQHLHGQISGGKIGTGQIIDLDRLNC